MRENVGTFQGKAENWRTGSFLHGANLCQEYFGTCGKFFRYFPALRLVFALNHPGFRRNRPLSTTACASIAAVPQSWWPSFWADRAEICFNQCGSSRSLVLCAAMINSFVSMEIS